ncbi:glycosyltransferase [Demequina salsinemoris]|uniref:glycosyltransferase n=1 Tax=Demequina salsinemoris TaxID=577470 RepID=UPI000784D7BE|nr:glycosyltransferase [Demequina salsinemoris]
MRIIHLLKHAVRGNGSVHMAVDLACAQADAGHEVWFASARGSYDAVLAEHGVHVTDLPEPDSKKHALENMAALAGLMREVRPDVLHAHMMSSAVISMPLSLLFRAPLVSTMHNSFDTHSWLMRVSRRVVAVSEAERRLLRSRRYPDRQVVTVLNGTAGSAREGQDFDDIGPLHRPSIMTLSGLHPRKAVGDVLAAFAMIADEHPEWHLNILGWGASREDLETQATDAGLTDRVHFMGSTLTPWAYLAQTDVVATATLADPCPLTVMEARVAGAAVVGTKVGGIPEVLGYGAYGHLVDTHAPEQIADAFRDLLDSDESLATWRSLAHEGSEHFTVQRMARDYDDVYVDVLPGAKRRGLAAERGDDGLLRIAYLVPPSRHFAGIERVVHELASELATTFGDELDVHVIYASHYAERELGRTSYTKHELGVDRLLGLAGPLRRMVRRQRIDVLVSPQVEATTVSWLATRGRGMPSLIGHLHGNPRVEEEGGSLLTRASFKAFRGFVSRDLAGVLAVSPSLADYVKEHLSSGTKALFSKNPVRDLHAPERREREDDAPFTFICVARLAYQKGHDVLLRAFALAAEDLDGARLLLVGSGPAEQDLKALARELRIEDRVEFAGYVSEPAPLLASADCFVLASRWEGFGVALVEALQFGLPVLATDCQFGPSDVITDAELGEVVASEDPGALAEGLKRARVRVDTKAAASHRRAVASEYGPAEAARHHLQALREVVGARLAARTEARTRAASMREPA